MGTFDDIAARTGWGIPGEADTHRSAEEIAELIQLSRSADGRIRKIAVANLCPCHVRSDYPPVWDRVLEMIHDPDPLVRRTVVHMLADGSPRGRQAQVLEALDALRNDPDRKVRRQVHHVLGEQRRTGRVNVL